MASRNDITGDAIISKNPSKAYLDNFDNIFPSRKKKEENLRFFRSVLGFLDDTDYLQVDSWDRVTIVDKVGIKYPTGWDLAYCLKRVEEGNWVEFTRD